MLLKANNTIQQQKKALKYNFSRKKFCYVAILIIKSLLFWFHIRKKKFLFFIKSNFLKFSTDSVDLFARKMPFVEQQNNPSTAALEGIAVLYFMNKLISTILFKKLHRQMNLENRRQAIFLQHLLHCGLLFAGLRRLQRAG